MMLVKKVLKDVVEKNNLGAFIEPEKVSVKVIENNTLILFYNFDNTFFVASKCLKIANLNEYELALLICSELSHFLLSHTPKRVFESLFQKYIFRKLFRLSDDVSSTDPLVKDLEERTSLHKHSPYYPE